MAARFPDSRRCHTHRLAVPTGRGHTHHRRTPARPLETHAQRRTAPYPRPVSAPSLPPQAPASIYLDHAADNESDLLEHVKQLEAQGEAMPPPEAEARDAPEMRPR